VDLNTAASADPSQGRTRWCSPGPRRRFAPAGCGPVPGEARPAGNAPNQRPAKASASSSANTFPLN